MMEKPIKMDDVGVPLFLEAPTWNVYSWWGTVSDSLLASIGLPNEGHHAWSGREEWNVWRLTGRGIETHIYIHTSGIHSLLYCIYENKYKQDHKYRYEHRCTSEYKNTYTYTYTFNIGHTCKSCRITTF